MDEVDRQPPSLVPEGSPLNFGRPLEEQLRDAGITAAVVGVILSLALFFGAAVVFPQGWAGGPDLFALVLTLAALAALRLWKLDLLWVIAGGIAAGLLRGLAASTS